MGHAVLKELSDETTPQLIVIDGGLSTAEADAGSQSVTISREITILAIVLMALQVLDGLFTAIGVHHFGLDAEGNPLLRWAMFELGHLPALALAKGLAILIVFWLALLSPRVGWLTHAFKVVIALYLFAAILPWTGILLFRLT